MKNSYKIVRNSLGIICLAFIALVCVLSKKSDLYQIDSPFRSDMPVPHESWEIVETEETLRGEKFIIQRVFTKEEFGKFTLHPSIVFGTVNVRVRVFCNDEQIYSFGNNGKNFVGLSSGDSCHFIRIPEKHYEEFTLRIEETPFIEGRTVPKILPNLVLGAMADLVNGFKRDCAPEGIVSFGILVVGFLGFLLSLTFWGVLKKFPIEYFAWSIFSTLCGVMFLFDSHFIDLYVANSFLLYFVPAILMACMPAVFNIYVSTNKSVPYNRSVMLFFSIASCVVVIFDCLAAFSLVVPFMVAKMITTIFLIVWLFFLIAIQVTEFITFSGFANLRNIVFLISLFTLIFDLGMNLIPPENEFVFVFSRPTFFVLFIVQTVYIINDFFNIQILSARKEVYENAITQDVLAGTLSRNVFWKNRANWQKKKPEDKLSTLLVLCEISNLRLINENFSFEKGDEAIKLIGSLLQQNFSSNNVYRFDLGTFAIIIEGMTEDVLLRKIHDVNEYIEDYNKGVPCPTKIHFGFDFYNKDQDVSFDAFVTRVQMLLYEDKLR